MRQMLTLVFALSLLAGGLGCSKKGVDLDTSKTIAFDPSRDKMPVVVGPGEGSKGKGKGGGAAPAK